RTEDRRSLRPSNRTTSQVPLWEPASRSLRLPAYIIPTRYLTSALIDGPSSPSLGSRILLELNRSGNLTAMRISTSSLTIALTEGAKSCGKIRYPELKDTSAIRLTTASGPLLTHATPSAALRWSTESIRIIHNKMSFWEAS